MRSWSLSVKVLIAHNRYRSVNPSGENAVVDDDAETLRARGVDVEVHLEDSDSITGSVTSYAQAAVGPVHGLNGLVRFKERLDRYQPDVVHLHNVFPLLSPAAVIEAKKRGVPVVMTMHNYRLGCVAGTHFREGRVCIDCLGSKLSLPAVRHGCYRGSRLQTVPMVVGQIVHRGTWRAVDKFLVLTDFMLNYLASLGIDRSKIVVRPTSSSEPVSHLPPGGDVFFAGRLDDSKGILLLIEAWQKVSGSHRVLRIAGSGPLEAFVREAARRTSNISFLGSLSRPEVAQEIERCGVVCVPSLWFEGLPKIVVEAFAGGRPVICFDHGSVGSAVNATNGWSGPPRLDFLISVLQDLSSEEIAKRGSGALRTFRLNYTSESSAYSLLRVYSELCGF